MDQPRRSSAASLQTTDQTFVEARYIVPEVIDTPTSLAKKDTSNTFEAGEQESEVLEERTRSFKKFRLPDAPDGRKRYRIGGQIGPVHYKKDPYSETELFKEIDLTVVPTPDKPWDYAMETNGYQVYFYETTDKRQETGDFQEGLRPSPTNEYTKFVDEEFVGTGLRPVRVVDHSGQITVDRLLYVAEFHRAGKWLKLNPIALVWENDKGEQQIISTVQESNAPPIIDNNEYHITWKNVFGEGIDFRYNLSPDKFFKTVIVRSADKLPKPTIDSKGLKLTVVLGMAWDETTKLGNDFAKGVRVNELPGVEEWKGTDSFASAKVSVPDSTGAIDNRQSTIDQRFSTINSREGLRPFPTNILLNKYCRGRILCDPYRTGLRPVRSSEVSGQLSVVSGQNYDEIIINPHEFKYTDEHNREVWWLHQPKAWDSADQETTASVEPRSTDAVDQGRHEFLMDWSLKRKGNKVIADVSLPAEVLNNSNLVFPLYIDAAIPEEQVGASADDIFAYNQFSSWTSTLNGTNLFVGYQQALFYGKGCGLRFTTVPVPSSSTIDNASLSVKSDGIVGSANVKSRLRFENADNPAAFTNYANYSGRTRTASIDYDNNPAFVAGNWYTTPNVASLLQTVINRAGWQSNNSVVLFWDDHDHRTSGIGQISFYSWDAPGNVSGPKLNVSYTEPVSNTAPAASTVTDNLDPVDIGANVTFTGEWTEADAADLVKMYVCKDAACTNCNNTSQANCWCYSSGNQTQPDVTDTCTYTALEADVGAKSYWLGVCDDEPSCDASPLSGGTFTVRGRMSMQGVTSITGITSITF